MPCGMCVCAVCVCAYLSVLLSSSIFIYGKKSRNTESGVLGWEFSPLTVNAKVLNKDSELILNMCIYV